MRMPIADSCGRFRLRFGFRRPGPAAWAITACLALAGAGPAAQGGEDVRGSWEAREYLLRTGEHYPVKGLIFFTERDWTVLYFVAPGGSDPKRGSAEGGTYELSGDRLVFKHLYNLSVGEAVPGLPESPLRMVVREAADAPDEPTRIEVAAGRLTLFFPSGNRMLFERSSAP